MKIPNSQSEYLEVYQSSVSDPEKFWSEMAEDFTWRKKWSKTLEWDFHKPEVKWFVGGKLNITENCIDRHLPARANQTAIVWESNDPKEPSRKITYQELHDQVCKVGNMLKAHGIKKGDRVCIYMPMVPEAAYAMLGCARIGAVHSLVFAGFSSGSLVDRINDSQCRLVLTADGAMRGDKRTDLKSIVDNAIEKCPSVEKVIVLERTKSHTSMQHGRDFWWHDEMKKVEAVCVAEEMDAEDLLFILYTSGSTGKPKGMVHTIGGYMVYVNYTFRTAFQYDSLTPALSKGEGGNAIYWCSADIGWVTGHSYIVYGPLSAGATSVMYEVTLDYPNFDRWWRMVAKHRVNIFYTSPTAIRALIRQGDHWPEAHDLSRLRLLGSVGEPINPAAWEWYHRVIGKGRCPIVDTWWQTETGGILIAPMPGAVPLKPGSGTLPIPGVIPDIVDFHGRPVEPGHEGFLILRRPWPGMIRNIWGDPERFKEQYWTRVPGAYFTGDAARCDHDGYYWILGRGDDVMDVSGHTTGTIGRETLHV